MKKIKILIAVILFTTVCVSQSYAQVGFQLGIKGGPNFSNIKTEVSTEGQTGFHAGAYAMIKVSKIGIQPELLFSSISSDITSGSVTSEFTSSYVNIPVILKVYLAGGLNLQVGPQFGFATFSELKTAAAGTTTTTDLKDELKGSDVSLAIGAGFDLPFGLNLTARYNLGLSNVNDKFDFDLDPATDDELRNQVFQVSVGYSFIKK